MGKTAIEWTDKVWNCVRGCSRVSAGCQNCYAERMAATRLSAPGQPYHGLAEMTESGPKWTGKIQFVPEKLDEPLRWPDPCMVFVNSMSDLFRADNEDIAAIFGVMSAAKQHVFQVLTKQPKRMKKWFDWVSSEAERANRSEDEFCREFALGVIPGAKSSKGILTKKVQPLVGVKRDWPLDNVWIGVSVEDDRAATQRIDLLLETPAAVRFLSIEPLIGEILGISQYLYAKESGECGGCSDPACEWHESDIASCGGYYSHNLPGVNWVIVGGESGPNARPMDIDWVRQIREACVLAHVPFFFKQWGGLNKKEAGCDLDGRIWKQMPAIFKGKR